MAKLLLTMKLEKMNPKTATAMLSKGQLRPWRETVTARYAQLMLDGKWTINGMPIVIDWNGDLVDGQHRLQAIVSTGLEIEMIVIRGVTPQARDTIQDEFPWQGGDLLAIRGVKNYAVLAAAVRIMVAMARCPAGQYQNQGIRNPDIAFAWDHFSKQKQLELDKQASFVLGLRSTKFKMPPSILLWLYHTAHRHQPRAADKFANNLATGENLKAGSPIYALRERLMRMPARRRARHELIMAWTVKAWNFYRQGKKLAISHLQWRDNEEFPKLLVA